MTGCEREHASCRFEPALCLAGIPGVRGDGGGAALLHQSLVRVVKGTAQDVWTGHQSLSESPDGIHAALPGPLCFRPGYGDPVVLR